MDTAARMALITVYNAMYALNTEGFDAANNVLLQAARATPDPHERAIYETLAIYPTTEEPARTRPQLKLIVGGARA